MAFGRMTGDHSGVVGCEYSVPSLLKARSKIVEGQYDVDWGELGSEKPLDDCVWKDCADHRLD